MNTLRETESWTICSMREAVAGVCGLAATKPIVAPREFRHSVAAPKSDVTAASIKIRFVRITVYLLSKNFRRAEAPVVRGRLTRVQHLLQYAVAANYAEGSLRRTRKT